MIPKDRWRMAEVDFPVAAVSRRAAWEKSIQGGHACTLTHLLGTAAVGVEPGAAVGAVLAGSVRSAVSRSR